MTFYQTQVESRRLGGQEFRRHPFSSGKFKLVFNKQSKVINGKLSIGTQRKSRVSGPFCSTNCRSQSEKCIPCLLFVFYTIFLPVTGWLYVQNVQNVQYINYIHFFNDLFYMHWSKIVGPQLLFKKNFRYFSSDRK